MWYQEDTGKHWFQLKFHMIEGTSSQYRWTCQRWSPQLHITKLIQPSIMRNWAYDGRVNGGQFHPNTPDTQCFHLGKCRNIELKLRSTKWTFGLPFLQFFSFICGITIPTYRLLLVPITAIFFFYTIIIINLP